MQQTISSTSAGSSATGLVVLIMSLVIFLSISLGLIGLFLIYLKKKEKKLQAELLTYASTRGFQFLPGNHGEMSDGGVYKYGKISNIINGGLPQSKNDFRQYYQTEVKGSGKNKRVYRRTIMVVDCPDTLSHFILNSKLNTNQSESWAFSLFDGSQKLSLEGNFSEFYDTYSPTGDERQLLTFLSPDVIEFILSKCSEYDIEILGGKMFLYGYPHFTAQKRGDMIDLCDSLVAKLQIRKDDVRRVVDVASGSFQSVARATENDGTRAKLSTSKLKSALLVFVFLLAVSAQLFKTKLSNSAWLVITVVFFAFIIVLVAFGYTKQKRIKEKHKAYIESIKNDNK